VPAEIVQVDHQHKPDVGAGTARRWLDSGGGPAIADVTNSAVALAVSDVIRDKNKLAKWHDAIPSANLKAN
jgi:branched-chain amino acid transport system substrate-binding protein